MSLNIEKRINFSRKLQPTIPSYLLNESKLQIKTVVKDLGILIDSKLSFNYHFDVTLSKANKVFRYIKRYGRDFLDIRTLKTLFVSLVRPILEYGCVIWSPYYITHSERFEKIKYKFF